LLPVDSGAVVYAWLFVWTEYGFAVDGFPCAWQWRGCELSLCCCWCACVWEYCVCVSYSVGCAYCVCCVRPFFVIRGCFYFDRFWILGVFWLWMFRSYSLVCRLLILLRL